MKKFILVLFILSIPLVSASFTEEFEELWESNPVIDPVIEAVVMIVSFVSFVFMELARKKTEGPLLKEGFKYISLGFLVLSIGGLYQVISETIRIENVWDAIFKEVLTIGGMVLIMIGPIKIFKHTQKLTEHAKR